MTSLWIPHRRESTVRMNYCGFSNRFPASIRRAMISNNSSMDNINCGSIRCQCNTDGHISVTSIVLQHCVTMQHQLWLDQVPVHTVRIDFAVSQTDSTHLSQLLNPPSFSWWWWDWSRTLPSDGFPNTFLLSYSIYSQVPRPTLSSQSGNLTTPCTTSKRIKL